MGDRVVDCARLESVCAERHRGFESLPIRADEALKHVKETVVFDRLSVFWVSALQDLKFLPQFDNRAMRQEAAEIHSRINKAIAA